MHTVTQKPAFDLSGIMADAWERTREALRHNPRLPLRPNFRRYLREAWISAKVRIEAAREKAALEARTVESLSREIDNLENRDRIGAEGANRLAKLRAALATVREREDFAAKRAQRHPNLLPVWDAEAAAPRSVNLATVSRIVADGQVHTFA